MNGQEIVERLIRECPKFHYIPEETSRQLAGLGIEQAAGFVNYAVAPEVLRYFAQVVKPNHLTIETGSGQSTVALAALAGHHVCVTYPEMESVEATQKYMHEVGIPRDRITWVVEPSEIGLPKLALAEKVNFAFIDGCHGYPFPALDWHYLDLHLKVGGIMGFDNTEIRAVQNHLAFLEANGSYRLVHRIGKMPYSAAYGVNFYEKLRDEEREWVCQPYNRQQAEPDGQREAEGGRKGLLAVWTAKIKGLFSS